MKSVLGLSLGVVEMYLSGKLITNLQKLSWQKESEILQSANEVINFIFWICEIQKSEIFVIKPSISTLMRGAKSKLMLALPESMPSSALVSGFNDPDSYLITNPEFGWCEFQKQNQLTYDVKLIVLNMIDLVLLNLALGSSSKEQCVDTIFELNNAHNLLCRDFFCRRSCLTDRVIGKRLMYEWNSECNKLEVWIVEKSISEAPFSTSVV